MEMEKGRVHVTDEYLESVGEWLLEWVTKPKSMVLTEFLEERGIGYPFFRYFCELSPKLQNIYEVVKANLSNKWLRKGLSENNLATHQQKLVLRYVGLYDSHARDLNDTSKAKVAAAEQAAQTKYILEDYARSKLEQPFKQNYDDNVNKRRSRAKA